MTRMSRQLSALNIQLATTNKQNALLLVSARKAKVDETVGKLTNPMSVGAVRLNIRILFMLEDMLSVFKPDGLALVSTNLDLLAAAVVVWRRLSDSSKRIRRFTRWPRIVTLGGTSFPSLTLPG